MDEFTLSISWAILPEFNNCTYGLDKGAVNDSNPCRPFPLYSLRLDLSDRLNDILNFLFILLNSSMFHLPSALSNQATYLVKKILPVDGENKLSVVAFSDPKDSTNMFPSF